MAGTQRYWDGSKWSEHVAPLQKPSAPAPQTEEADGYAVGWGCLLGLVIPVVGAIIALSQMGKRGVGQIWACTLAGFVIWYFVITAGGMS